MSIYAYQGMATAVSQPHQGWLDQVTSLQAEVVLSVPQGHLVAVQTSFDPEPGNPAWVYRFELRSQDGQVRRLTRNCLCMGADPISDLKNGFNRSYGLVTH